MVRKFLMLTIFVFVCLGDCVSAKEIDGIEIFNIDYEKIDKIVPVEYEVQKLTENYIYGIEGVYAKFNPIPSMGFAIKIPLAPALQAQAKGIKEPIDQVIIMFPKNEAPFLMIIEAEDKLNCFTFKGDTAPLLESLDYDPY